MPDGAAAGEAARRELLAQRRKALGPTQEALAVAAARAIARPGLPLAALGLSEADHVRAKLAALDG